MPNKNNLKKKDPAKSQSLGASYQCPKALDYGAFWIWRFVWFPLVSLFSGSWERKKLVGIWGGWSGEIGVDMIILHYINV